MYHEEKIQYISPTRLANKYVTTNKLILIIIYLLSPPSFLVRLFYILFSYPKLLNICKKKERTFSYVLMSKQVYDLIISYNTSFTLILDTNQ